LPASFDDPDAKELCLEVVFIRPRFRPCCKICSAGVPEPGLMGRRRWSTPVHGLGPCGEGLRGFESHPPHQNVLNSCGIGPESRLPSQPIRIERTAESRASDSSLKLSKTSSGSKDSFRIERGFQDSGYRVELAEIDSNIPCSKHILNRGL
jgi:hypothetical protein